MRDVIIRDEDVRWDDEEPDFVEPEQALAVLLATDQVILNNYWWRNDLSEEDKEGTSIAVDCSDVFAWGCADAEPLPYNSIKDCFCAWEKDENWGCAVWAITRRRLPPQKPIADILTKRGYDVEALVRGELHGPSS